jgi:hypothetical protein
MLLILNNELKLMMSNSNVMMAKPPMTRMATVIFMKLSSALHDYYHFPDKAG